MDLDCMGQIFGQKIIFCYQRIDVPESFGESIAPNGVIVTRRNRKLWWHGCRLHGSNFGSKNILMSSKIRCSRIVWGVDRAYWRHCNSPKSKVTVTRVPTSWVKFWSKNIFCHQNFDVPESFGESIAPNGVIVSRRNRKLWWLDCRLRGPNFGSKNILR